MTNVTCDLAISADGYSAGFEQSETYPFGFDGGIDWRALVVKWMMETPEENRAEMQRVVAANAFIMGRNMFTPQRGDWNLEWTGWWGDDPPYHAPTFVLTNYPRDPLPMQGGTTFYFVTDGIESAMRQAREAAGDGNVSIAGGATTVNQFLAAGLIDELRLHISPFTMGTGVRLFEGVPPLKMDLIESRSTSNVTHITYRMLR